METEFVSRGESGAEETPLGLWYLLTSAAALLAMCFYFVYMSVHLIALSYAWAFGRSSAREIAVCVGPRWKWLHSRTAEIALQKFTSSDCTPGVSIIKVSTT